MAFQIVDDILDVVATDEQLGKPSGNDLVEGVYTLPVIRTLADDADGELAGLLGRPLDDAEQARAKEPRARGSPHRQQRRLRRRLHRGGDRPPRLAARRGQRRRPPLGGEEPALLDSPADSENGEWGQRTAGLTHRLTGFVSFTGFVGR